MIGEGRVLGRCQKSELTGWTGHFENETGFFQELMKNDFLRSYYLGFDWYGRIALIKSKIFITTGMPWPISSDKWKASLLASRFASFPWHIARLEIPLVCKLKNIVLPGLQTQTQKMSRSVYNYRLIRLNGLSCITDGDNFD